jgi:hypothetical protein
MSVTLNGSNGITFNDGSSQTAAASPFGLKNRIINGDMRINQRNSTVTITNADTYSVDRFFGTGQASDGVFTLQQSTTAPTGFNNSLLATVTTADSSIGSSQYYLFIHRIEGYNIADLGWGTANAKTVTLSFWIRSSVTGTFGGSLRNSAADRSYPFSYTISAANTWEQKTITIAGDTSGTWLTDNGIGISIAWSLGDGSSRLNTAGAWAAGSYSGATGQTNLIATNGATLYITGIQLEVGSTATPFERRQYGNELALCQRYYQKYSDYDSLGIGRDTGTAFFGYPLRPKMRTNPTCTYTCGNVDRFGIAFTATTAAVVLDARDNHVTTYTSVTMSGRGEPCGPANSVLTASAEL